MSFVLKVIFLLMFGFAACFADPAGKNKTAGTSLPRVAHIRHALKEVADKLVPGLIAAASPSPQSMAENTEIENTEVAAIAAASPPQPFAEKGVAEHAALMFQSGSAKALANTGQSPPAPKQTNIEWVLMVNDEPKVEDVVQGFLRDCYFLSVIAALAHHRPSIIVDTFASTKSSSTNTGRLVFVVRMLVGGEYRNVAVDTTVPMFAPPPAPTSASPPTGTQPSFLFANAHDGVMWPIILEKAFAKIHGSYQAIAGGTPREAFRAFTEAPVDIYKQREDPHEQNEALASQWAALKKACDKKWPAVVGSRDIVSQETECIACHIFVVLQFSGNRNGVEAVQLYDPYGTTTTVVNKRGWDMHAGKVWLTQEEFGEFFEALYVARVDEIYKAAAATMIVKPAEFEYTRLSVEIKSGAYFGVNLAWPHFRLFPVGCFYEGNMLNFQVSLKTPPPKNGDYDVRSSPVESNDYCQITDLGLDSLEGPGEYVLYLHGELKAPVLDHVVVNIYARGNVTLQSEYWDGRAWSKARTADRMRHPGVVFDEHPAVEYDAGGSHLAMPCDETVAKQSLTRVRHLENSAVLMNLMTEESDPQFPNYVGSIGELLYDRCFPAATTQPNPRNNSSRHDSTSSSCCKWNQLGSTE